MIWNVPKIWEGEDVWIIGGGPSLTSTFQIPDDITRKVRAKQLPLSAYSPFMKVLHDKHIIGVNVAYQLGDWVDIAFCGDQNFVKLHEDRMYEFPGLTVTCSPVSIKSRWMKYLQRVNAGPRNLTKNTSQVCWNKSSGAAAINLAVHLGAARIILVAFDMTLLNNKQHWHNAYRTGSPDITDPTEQRKKEKTIGRHLAAFPGITHSLSKLGVPIYNISPDSSISSIEKKTLEELL